MTEKIKALRAKHDDAVKELRAAADTAESLPDDATQEQRQAADDAFAAAEKRVEETLAGLRRQERLEEARAANPAPAEPILVGAEPLTYGEHDVRQSYLLDLARAETGRGDVDGARKRLSRHAEELRVEITARKERRRDAFDRELDRMLSELERVNPAAARAAADAGLAEKRAINRTDGTGGEFVPPLWLIDRYAGLARAARPFADACPTVPLPAGTDSINVPRITTGTLTGVQTADNAAVTSQDIATATVTAPVRTIAGQEDVALQLLDQSPIAFDQVVFQDLAADYALQLDAQCLNGSGASGQLLGILNVSGINAVTYTDATPTLPELWPKVADAYNQCGLNRKLPPTFYWLHSRRWAWAASQLDTANRPLITINSGGPQNAYGSYSDAWQQGLAVSNFLGIPVYVDLSIPTNLGGGSNEDRIIATRMSDHVLFEGEQNVRVLKEILSGTLGVRFQLWSYVAFTAGRFPAGTSVIAGTGLITPTF